MSGKPEFVIVGYSHPDGRVSLMISTQIKGDAEVVTEYEESDPIESHGGMVMEWPMAKVSGHHIQIDMRSWSAVVGVSYEETLASLRALCKEMDIDLSKLPKVLTIP